MLCLGLLQAGASGGIGSMLPMFVILGLGYFLLLRPAQQQKRRQEAMRSDLKPGDRVVTSSGLHGTVAKLRDQRVFLRVADGVQLEFELSAVSALVEDEASE